MYMSRSIEETLLVYTIPFCGHAISNHNLCDTWSYFSFKLMQLQSLRYVS